MASDDLVWADLPGGTIQAQTPNAVGFRWEGRHEICWVGKSVLKLITYPDGESMEVRFRGTPVEAIQIPKWLARDIGLDWTE